MVPITIVSGFLGAGKTSLLNHLLNRADGRRIAVLVNDFGTVNIDAQLIENRDAEVISLENGCICCSLSDGFLASVVGMIRRPRPPDQIVVETSGVADPIEIAQTLADPDLQSHAPLESVVTVVDAELALALDGEALHQARRQVAVADLVLINKSDLVDADTPHKVKQWVLAMSPATRVLETQYSQVPPEVIFGASGLPLHSRLQARGDHDHSDASAFETFTYDSHKPISLHRLYALLQSLPSTVLRVKGILHLHEKPGYRCILQATGKRATITVGEPWSTATPASQIVFIGLSGGIDDRIIRRSLGDPPSANIPSRLD